LRVRIKTHPYEREMDGLRLDGFEPGAVRDVSPSLGTWLVVKGYAEPEMRRTERRPHQPGPDSEFLDRRKRVR
jgi:hypothetical protein